MEAVDKARLRKYLPQIVHNVRYTALSFDLIREGLVSSADHERIKTKATEEEKMEEFLYILRRGGPKAFGNFLRVLECYGHSAWLAKTLQEHQVTKEELQLYGLLAEAEAER